MISLTIDKSIDVEDEIRAATFGFLTVYCRPLPKNFSVPSIEVRKIGGSEENTIDTATVMLYSRGKTPAEADDYLRKAIGVIKAICKMQSSALRHIEVNASGAWSEDPVRPDLSLCTATLLVTVHQNTTEVYVE